MKTRYRFFYSKTLTLFQHILIKALFMADLTDFMLTTFRRALETFIIFTDEEWNLFAAHLYLRKFKKREAFINNGTVCNEVGFIYSGSFRFFFLRFFGGAMMLPRHFSEPQRHT